MLHTTVSLTEVLNNIKLANNGYVFASSLSPEYLRRTEQLVGRGAVWKAQLRKKDGSLEIAYFISKFAMSVAFLNESTSDRAIIDYETKLLNRTEQYLSEC